MNTAFILAIIVLGALSAALGAMLAVFFKRKQF